LYLIPLITVTLFLSCNFINGTNQETDSSEANQNELQEEQNQSQVEQDQGQMVQGQFPGQDDQWYLISHGGMEFWYDPKVILDIEASTIPWSEGGAYEEPHPAFIQYSLLLDSGAISVVEIEIYKNVSDVAAQIFPELQTLIANQNAQSSDCIPELPLVSFFHECSHQQFNSNVKFIDFENGSGVRFVTVYGIQDAAPVSNEILVYTFQGITEDQQCYVKASFMLTHQELEDFAEIPAEIYADSTGTALDNYFSDFEQLLNGNPDGFSPSLARFDLIISSIEMSYCLGG
jgi:hypothetical protein